MLKTYLSTRLKAWESWLQHPERDPAPHMESYTQERVDHFKDVQEEFRLLKKLDSRPMIDLLRAECKISFSTLEISVATNYRADSSDNVIQIFDDRGLIKYREPFTKEGITRAFVQVEIDIMTRLTKEYPDGR